MIVIGIIGIIADMTIPSLIKKYEKLVLVTQLQKSVSVFTQGMKMIMAEEGVNSIGDTSFISGGGASYSDVSMTARDNAIKKTFNIVKTCKNGDTSCEISGYQTLNRGGVVPDDRLFYNGYNFYMADGMAINFDTMGVCKLYNNIGDCGWVLVDVNGAKKPNKVGRDVFYFILDRDGSLYPFLGVRDVQGHEGGGDWKTLRACEIIKRPLDMADGKGCAARIIENGWKMDY